MPEQSPSISVIIPHLNQPEFLGNCLKSLKAGRRTPDEIIVVDNGSSTLPHEICDAYSDVALLKEARPGPGPARNAGASVARGNILAFIDADCLADRDWLASAAEEMEDRYSTILGGDVRISCGDPNRLTALEAYESVYGYRMDRYISRQGFTGTGNLVARREVVTDVGPFAGIGVAEDRDWGQRATAKGYRIRYVAGMKVYHPARKTFVELCMKWDRQAAHDYVKAQREGRLFLFLIKTLAMALSPLAEVPRILASDRISGLRSRVLAFAVLSRIRLYRTGIMLRLLTGADPERLAGRWNRT